MRKMSLLTLIVLMLIAVFPVNAQDDEYEACTTDEFIEGAEIIESAFDDIASIMEIADEPDASDYTAAVLLIDSYTLGYWEGFSEASYEGLCAELDWFGYTAGLVLDEMLITTQLSALALHESDAGNDDLAEELVTLSIDRAETLEASIDAIIEILAAVEDGEMSLDFELAECSDDEFDATEEGLEIIYEVYEELAILAEDAEGSDLSEIIVGFAVLSEEYWYEFMPEVPNCYEAQDEAIYAGLIIDESLIIASGYRLAELEAETGDEDVADALEENAEERLEFLEEAFEVYEDE